MNKSKFYPVMMALLSSILFGASAPITKMLLGKIEPIPLASILYLGSGLGLLIFQISNSLIKNHNNRYGYWILLLWFKHCTICICYEGFRKFINHRFSIGE